MKFSVSWGFLISFCIILPTKNMCFSSHNTGYSYGSPAHRSQNGMRQGGSSHRRFSSSPSTTKQASRPSQHGIKATSAPKSQGAKGAQRSQNKNKNHAHTHQRFSHTHGREFVTRFQRVFAMRNYHEIVNYVVFPCIWRRSPTEVIIMNTQEDFLIYQPLIFTPSVSSMLVAFPPSTVVVTSTGYTFAGGFVTFNNYGITAFGRIR
jgi:hypothetical protein